MTIGKPGAFIMGNSLVDRLLGHKPFKFDNGEAFTPPVCSEAANVITALEGAAKYALDVIGSTNRFDAEQCKAAADKLSAALSLLRGDGK